MRNYIEYLPDELKRFLEFQQIGVSDDKETTKMLQGAKIVLDNNFIMSLTEYGCGKWEKMLGLVRRDTDTIEDRRLRILAKFLNQLPYTERRLHEMLISLCGVNGYKLTVDTVNYRVTVKIDLGVKNQFVAVAQLLEGVVPLNMLLDVQLLYNRHMDLKSFTHEHLQAYTHQGLREDNLV